jgi:DNA helicase-2/ATP-dependent DNA helicase PcrA
MSVFILGEQGVPIHSGAMRKIDYAKELNQEQLDVVLNGDGPCLVLAGAGSGKTRTVTYRVAYLLEQGIDPSQILLLTFTNKAAREMLQRAETLIGHGLNGLRGGTFHSVANRVLRTYARELGHTPGFTILDQDDAQSLIKAILKERHIDPKARRFPTAAVLQNVLSLARNTATPVPALLAARYPSFETCADEISDVGEAFMRRKRDANAMDFDDLLLGLATLLHRPDVGPELASSCRYLLVDEYQDTNALQADIVRGFAKVHGNVIAVGDDAQSIYAFRGADVKNILSFPQWFPGAKTFKLLTNYRSIPEILEVANASIAHNEKQFPKELVAVRPSGPKPCLVPAASARQEAQFVAEQILKLRAEGTALGNMAVLFRSSAHSQQLEFELLKRDVPYEYRGGMKFFERAHIKDAVAYIRILQNPQDETAWLRVLALQPGIGATTAAQLAAQVRGVSEIRQVLDGGVSRALPSRARGGWELFLETARMAMDRSPSPADMLKAVIDNGYAGHLEREYPDWRDRLEDVEQLVVFARGYDRPDRFLADIALYDDALAKRDGKTATPGSKDDGNERMVLSTIHQAKGLEWEAVFVIHVADGLFPHRRASEEEAGIEEERRLFYVAVTRARKRLFLTYPVTAGFDAFMLNQPSLFVEELPPHLLDRVELREARPAASGWGRPAPRGGEWGWDGDGGSYDEPSIQIGDDGERRKPSSSTATVFKKKLPPADEPF